MHKLEPIPKRIEREMKRDLVIIYKSEVKRLKKKFEEYMCAYELLNSPYWVWKAYFARLELEPWVKGLKRLERKRTQGPVQDTFEQAIEHARTIDIRLVAESLGAEIKKGFTSCLLHSEKTASMSFKNNYFNCFGCHEGGDAITLVMKSQNCDFKEAIKFLSEIRG
ncbi:MAG: hypothetical protein KDD05_07385 [Psychroserpens sp.]|nr:hypothetical protein [Psychroserpens sp.]